MAGELPEAATKLRTVLDYLPCEACLSQPTKDQEVLCSICRRLDRQVAIRVATRTTVILERPSAPAAPVVIPAAPSAPEAPVEAPAPPAEPAAEAPKAPLPVRVLFPDEERSRAPGIEVVVEPIEPPAEAPRRGLFARRKAPEPAPAEAPPAAVAAAAPEPEPEPEWEDIVSYRPPDDLFEVAGRPERAAEAAPPAYEPPRATPEPAPEPAREAPPRPAEEVPQDDFVFRPPRQEEAPPAPEEAPEDLLPTEEIPVEEETSRWAPVEEFLPEEPAPAPVEEAPRAPPVEEIPPPAPVEEEPILETEIVEMEVLPEEEPIQETEIVEMEVLPDEEPAAAPAPAGSDLWRLRGFDVEAEAALARVGVVAITHLSGHDANELAERASLPPERLVAWIQVADLVQEVGVPVDSAIALVAAGVPGPRGLRDMDAEDIADRVAAFGGASISTREIKRWKRRA